MSEERKEINHNLTEEGKEFFSELMLDLHESVSRLSLENDLPNFIAVRDLIVIPKFARDDREAAIMIMVDSPTKSIELIKERIANHFFIIDDIQTLSLGEGLAVHKKTLESFKLDISRSLYLLHFPGFVDEKKIGSLYDFQEFYACIERIKKSLEDEGIELNDQSQNS